jgi:hypothetical protein
MKLRPFLAALALAGAVACSDNNTPTAPTNLSPQPSAPELKKQQSGDLIFTTTQTFTNTVTGATATVSSIQITSFSLDGTQLLASGVLTFVGGATEPFTDIAVSLTSNHGSCTILTLDLGPLHLDLLGLVIDLSAVSLDITAVSGPGNLLGNLLCSLTHLLDESPFPLAEILDLIAKINALLG